MTFANAPVLQVHCAADELPVAMVVEPNTGQSRHLLLPFVGLNVARPHATQRMPFTISNPASHSQTREPSAPTDDVKPSSHMQCRTLVAALLRVVENSGHGRHAVAELWAGVGLYVPLSCERAAGLASLARFQTWPVSLLSSSSPMRRFEAPTLLTQRSGSSEPSGAQKPGGA